jgi:hypothetical protein
MSLSTISLLHCHLARPEGVSDVLLNHLNVLNTLKDSLAGLNGMFVKPREEAKFSETGSCPYSVSSTLGRFTDVQQSHTKLEG